MRLRKSFGFFPVLVLVMTPSVSAGKVELSTYYPAPYGEYSQLKSTGNDTSNANVALQAQGSSGVGLVVTNANRVGIGTAGPIGILELNTTTQAFYPPRVTTAQRNAIASSTVSESAKEGAVVYNLDSGHDTLEVYNGSSWSGVGGSSGGSGRVVGGGNSAQTWSGHHCFAWGSAFCQGANGPYCPSGTQRRTTAGSTMSPYYYICVTD